jgi:hypothetical protein
LSHYKVTTSLFWSHYSFSLVLVSKKRYWYLLNKRYTLANKNISKIPLLPKQQLSSIDLTDSDGMVVIEKF